MDNYGQLVYLPGQIGFLSQSQTGFLSQPQTRFHDKVQRMPVLFPPRKLCICRYLPNSLDLLFLPDNSSRIRLVKSGPLCCPVPRGIDPLQHRYIVPRASLTLHPWARLSSNFSQGQTDDYPYARNFANHRGSSV